MEYFCTTTWLLFLSKDKVCRRILILEGKNPAFVPKASEEIFSFFFCYSLFSRSNLLFIDTQPNLTANVNYHERRERSERSACFIFGWCPKEFQTDNDQPFSWRYQWEFPSAAVSCADEKWRPIKSGPGFPFLLPNIGHHHHSVVGSSAFFSAKSSWLFFCITFCPIKRRRILVLFLWEEADFKSQ